MDAKKREKMEINEMLTAKGKLKLVTRNKNGRIIDFEIFDNLVVKVGRYHIADQMTEQLQAAMSHMGLGTDSRVQTENDTGLFGEIFRKAFTKKEQGAGTEANKVIYTNEFVAGEATGTLWEAGIFNAASGGTMLCRTTFAEGKPKGAGDSMTATWIISFTS